MSGPRGAFPAAQEHPVLVEFSKKVDVPVIGLNYKEVRGDGGFDMSKMSAEEEKKLAFQRANTWLSQHGDPYKLTVMDLDGRVGIDYGVYGVPETYVIDKAGVIRMKHTGPITPGRARQEDHAAAGGAEQMNVRSLSSPSFLPLFSGRPQQSPPAPPKPPSPPTRSPRNACSTFPKNCAAWSARTRTSPTPTPNWRRICAAKSAA